MKIKNQTNSMKNNQKMRYKYWSGVFTDISFQISNGEHKNDNVQLLKQFRLNKQRSECNSQWHQHQEKTKTSGNQLITYIYDRLFFHIEKEMVINAINDGIFINYQQPGLMKQAKWTIQEQWKLRELKQDQDSKQYVNWELISKKLNAIFFTNKTSKQCRERYINYLKFGENQVLSFEWSEEEIDLAIKLYIQHGSSWSTISSEFKNKSENSIKNKFNNCLRKCAKTLQDFESQIINTTKKSITSELLSTMLDLGNKIKKMVSSGAWKINDECMIFRFRTAILNFSFRPEKFSDGEISNLVRLIKSINVKLRCFGVFKVKNRKHWKLTQKCLQAICQFDHILIEPLKVECVKGEQISQIPEGANQKTSFDLSPFLATKIFSEQSQLLQLPSIQQYRVAQKRITLDEELFDIIGYQEPHSEGLSLHECGF